MTTAIKHFMTEIETESLCADYGLSKTEAGTVMALCVEQGQPEHRLRQVRMERPYHRATVARIAGELRDGKDSR